MSSSTSGDTLATALLSITCIARPETVHSILSHLACRAQLSVANTPVGQGKQDYVHSIHGGSASAPPLVCLPGYGAGAAFFFRNFPSLCQYFNMYAVDPLGTGMSGTCIKLLARVACCLLAQTLRSQANSISRIVLLVAILHAWHAHQMHACKVAITWCDTVSTHFHS